MFCNIRMQMSGMNFGLHFSCVWDVGIKNEKKKITLFGLFFRMDVRIKQFIATLTRILIFYSSLMDGTMIHLYFHHAFILTPNSDT